MGIRNKDVRRRGGDLYDRLSEAGQTPRKIIPVRFPIAEETYEIVQCVNEPMGMVERYVLEAICEFGPCSDADIEALLGLDRHLIGDVISELAKAGVDLQRQSDHVIAGESLQSCVRRQTLEKRIKHRRTFVVNPLTGDLLPITHVDDSTRWLAPFVTEDEEQEASDWLRVRLGDRATSGRRSLASSLSSNDSGTRERLGVPEGAIGFGGDTCFDRQLYSVVAFAVVTRNNQVEVYSAVDLSTLLSDRETSELNYWSRDCHGVEPWVFAEPKTINDIAETFAQNLEGVQCRAYAEDTLAITVQQLDRVLRVGGRKEISESGAMSMLQMDLVNGWSWRKNDFSIYRVVAGDVETESRLVILRAVDELRKIHRMHYRNQSDSFALAPWWNEFQTAFASRFVDAAENRNLKLDDLLVEAERVPDMQFLEWLEDVEIGSGSSIR